MPGWTAARGSASSTWTGTTSSSRCTSDRRLRTTSSLWLDEHTYVRAWPRPRAAQTASSGASVKMLLPSMHMPALHPLDLSARSPRDTSRPSRPDASEKPLETSNSLSTVGSSRKPSMASVAASLITATASGLPMIDSVLSSPPTTASVSLGMRNPAFSTLPWGGIPGTVLTGTSPPATMDATSPRPPPPRTSALWAARNTSVLLRPTASAMHSPAARAPAALIPNPWLTGRSFSIVMSNPRPGARSCATMRVMWAIDLTPSIVTVTTSSSLGSTVAVAPLSSLMPMPLEPADRGS